MDLQFTAEEQAFRTKIRAWTAENLPADIKSKVDRGIELERDDCERWMQILSGKGWIAPNWDGKDGGPGFSLGEKYIFEEELFMGGAPCTLVRGW